MNAPILSAVSLALLCAVPAVAAAQEHTAPRSGTVSARGATLVRVDARAGSLRIVGRPDISEVRVSGTARANREKYLEGIRLVTDRVGDEVHVEAVIPEVTVFFGRVNRALDLVIEVPQGLALDVHDSSGAAEIRNVASLRLDDSSGEVEIANVAGDVRVEDSSGDLRIDRVGGEVRVRDSSGDVAILNVRRGVVIESDGSGELDVREVAGSVLVREDGSGAIRVDEVRGDVTVEDDGSGGIRVGRVLGAVRVPRS